jgi:hypothetical protein
MPCIKHRMPWPPPRRAGTVRAHPASLACRTFSRCSPHSPPPPAMASPGALYPPSACYSQLVATPVARREAHALKGGQDSLLSSPRRFCGAPEPADPTTSCACSRRAVPEPPCPRKAGPHPAPEDSVQHTPTASDGSLLRTPLPATPPVAPPAPVTPHSRVFRFGSPLGSPMPAELLASGKAAGCGLKARQQSARAGVVSRVPASPRCRQGVLSGPPPCRCPHSASRCPHRCPHRVLPHSASMLATLPGVVAVCRGCSRAHLLCGSAPPRPTPPPLQRPAGCQLHSSAAPGRHDATAAERAATLQRAPDGLR